MHRASGLGEATARLIVSKGGLVSLFDLNEERGSQIAKELGTSALWPGPVNVTNEVWHGPESDSCQNRISVWNH